MYATVSIINVYKEGSLAIQQAGKTMSTKITILCKKCPFIRRGEFAGEVKNWLNFFENLWMYEITEITKK